MKLFTLKASVGLGGQNQEEDVLGVQRALNQLSDRIQMDSLLQEDGVLSSESDHSETCKAIGLFQKVIVGYSAPDYRIDAGGKTARMMSDLLLESDIKAAISSVTESLFFNPITPITGLTDADFLAAADKLNCDVKAIKAVSDVESSGYGFFNIGVPALLFEAHQFSKFTSHQYDDSNPNISSRRWNRDLYLGGKKEYLRLNQAMMLNKEAALLSASYGRYQIMGFNHNSAGFANVTEFVQAMFESENNHLIAFVHFILDSRVLSDSIRSLDWATFAYHYNGPGYAKNKYDEKMQAAYERYTQ